jgi:hypothetical protein
MKDKSTLFYISLFIMTYVSIVVAVTGHTFGAFFFLVFTFGIIFPIYIIVSIRDSRNSNNPQPSTPERTVTIIETPEVQLNNQNYFEISEIEGWCIVCKLPIYLHEDVIECPACYSVAHRSHLLEWVKIKGYCPNCGYSLKIVDFPCFSENSYTQYVLEP